MFRYLLMVVILLNCAKGFTSFQDEVSPSTLEFVTSAMCEAECSNAELKLCHRNCTRRHKDVHSSVVPRSATPGPGPSKPRLHCREATLISITWDFPQDSFFVVEIQDLMQQTWTPVNVTRRSMTTVHNLTNSTLYKFRIRAVKFDGQVGEVNISDWISTLSSTFQPEPVSEVSIVNVVNRPSTELLQVKISWKPGEDRTCFYEVVLWDLKPVPTQMNIKERFETVLNNLKFGTNYSVLIKGKSEDDTRESQETWFHFPTQECLDYFKNDLTKCAPPTPANVSAEEDPLYGMSKNTPLLYNVTVAWSMPELQPLLHEIELARMEPDACVLVRQNVSGNATWVTFSGVDVGYEYEAIVRAYSPGGRSNYANIVRKLADFIPTYPTPLTSEKPQITSMPNSESPGLDVKYIWWIVLPVGVALIVFSIWSYVARQQRKRNRHELRCQMIEKRNQKPPSIRTEYSGSVECDLDINPDLEIPRENLLLGEVIGEGAFGIVRKGTLQEGDNWRDVAVKMLRDEPSTEDLRQFRQEINVMQSVGRHPHIVSLIGCCTRYGRLRLVVEYCAEGDLLNLLRKQWNKLAGSPDKAKIGNGNSHRTSETIKYAELLQENTSDVETTNPLLGPVANKLYDIVSDGEPSSESSEKVLTPADLLSFARQIAKGMEYLANNRVVHRDLAARNVLVCSDRTIKISDFGLSRDIYEENVYRKKGSGRLPVKWMALESLLHQIYTTQSDVWSFGILLWEIVTLGGNPYPGIPTNKLFGLLREGYRMECPANCRKELYDIMLACWQAKPRDRPTFTELHKMLDNMLESSSPHKYLNLNHMNFKLDIKTMNGNEHLTRSSGTYLSSSSKQAEPSEPLRPTSPFIITTCPKYLNTPVKSKYEESSFSITVENEKN